MKFIAFFSYWDTSPPQATINCLPTKPLIASSSMISFGAGDATTRR